ncbi:FAD-dependent oxidoreductase [candidate division TA06 bacterium]|nr:FAD-dependent oxidoreductase [candidate division TA06 bacterium]
MDIVILGAGFSGLSAAYHLQQLGLECEVYEKEERVGGVCRTEIKEGYTFDHCGHLLHFRDSGIRKLIQNLIGDQLSNHTRQAWIFSKGVYTRYPFQSNLYGLPKEVIEECLLGFIEARNTKHEARSTNFEDWIYAHFGKGIAKHFMIPYNRKLWTVPPRELTTDWMGRFVPQVSLKEILHGSLIDSKTQLGYNVTFDYPKRGGIESVALALARKVQGIHTQKKAIRILLSSRYGRKQRGAHHKIRFEGGFDREFKTLISTIPLPELIRKVEGVPERVRKAAENLRHTSILNLCFVIDRPKVSEKHWVYVPEERFPFYRIGFPSNFSPYSTPKGTSSITVEVSYRRRKPTSVVDRVLKGLREMDLIKRGDKILFHHVIPIPYAYVIYDQHYKPSMKIIQGYLKGKGIHSIGRFGGWQYTSIEDVILEGKETAEKITLNR